MLPSSPAAPAGCSPWGVSSADAAPGGKLASAGPSRGMFAMAASICERCSGGILAIGEPDVFIFTVDSHKPGFSPSGVKSAAAASSGNSSTVPITISFLMSPPYGPALQTGQSKHRTRKPRRATGACATLVHGAALRLIARLLHHQQQRKHE